MFFLANHAKFAKDILSKKDFKRIFRAAFRFFSIDILQNEEKNTQVLSNPLNLPERSSHHLSSHNHTITVSL